MWYKITDSLMTWIFLPLQSTVVPGPYTRLASVEESRPCVTSFRRCCPSPVHLRIALAALLCLSLVLAVFSQPAIDHCASFGTGRKTDNLDWSQHAYCQYVTNEAYLCNALMIFDSLSQTESQAARVMLYPQEWDPESEDTIGYLLRRARDEYNVQLSPIQVQHFAGDPTWADSFTKLLAFNLTQFQRVISLDSDATLLQSMDELFLLPPAPVAMPRAYWLEDTLSTQLIVIEPFADQFRRIQHAVAHRAPDGFDMDIVNELYSNDCIVIPHRRYGLLTGEFRAEDHTKYLGSAEEAWHPEVVLEEAKFVHFSDWPLPKPWLPRSREKESSLRPKCHLTPDGEDCRDRDVWLGLYQDFRNRREVRPSVIISQARGKYTDTCAQEVCSLPRSASSRLSQRSTASLRHGRQQRPQS